MKNLNQKTVNQSKGMHQQVDAILQSYFFAGNYEHQMALISNAILNIVNKGTSETSDRTLDRPFEDSNRYIRESVSDLVALQKFLSRLHIVYLGGIKT